MKITEIFIDLDDTLNSMTIPAMRLVGCPMGNDFAYDEFPIAGSYDIVEAVNTILGGDFPRAMSPSKFWNQLKYNFWAKLPKSQQFKQILSFAYQVVGFRNVCILTSPTLDPLCSAGKVEWMQQNLPAVLQRQFLIGPRKHFCAKPGSLLIDDCDQNIHDFRKAGGFGILVPRPWNSLHAIDTFSHLRREFRELKAAQ